MGEGIQSGTFFDIDRSAAVRLPEILPSDMTDIYNASPEQMSTLVERAYAEENPELALFVTGILAARTMERNNTADVYAPRDFKQALRSVMTTMASLEPLVEGSI